VASRCRTRSSQTPGAFSYGATDTDDGSSRRTVGDPTEGTVVLTERRGPDGEADPGPRTAFLAAVVSRRHVGSVVPDDVPSAAPAFVPSGA
jgi:hypothetical protein